MAEDKDALIRHYRQTRENFLEAIGGLSEDQMTEKSLDGWSIKDHLAHIALWDEIRAQEVTRISAGHNSTWRMSGEQDEVYNTLGYDLRAELPLDQAKWELETSRQRLLDAISSATPRGLDSSLYGEAALVSAHEVQHAGWIRRWCEERQKQ